MVQDWNRSVFSEKRYSLQHFFTDGFFIFSKSQYIWPSDDLDLWPTDLKLSEFCLWGWWKKGPNFQSCAYFSFWDISHLAVFDLLTPMTLTFDLDEFFWQKSQESRKGHIPAKFQRNRSIGTPISRCVWTDRHTHTHTDTHTHRHTHRHTHTHTDRHPLVLVKIKIFPENLFLGK